VGVGVKVGAPAGRVNVGVGVPGVMVPVGVLVATGALPPGLMGLLFSSLQDRGKINPGNRMNTHKIFFIFHLSMELALCFTVK
jgi:hypothetical protein